MDAVQAQLMLQRWKENLPPWRGKFCFDPFGCQYSLSSAITDPGQLTRFGQRLRAGRQAMKLSIDRLAARAHTSRSTIQRLEFNKTKMLTVAVADRLSAALGMTAHGMIKEGTP